MSFGDLEKNGGYSSYQSGNSRVGGGGDGEYIRLSQKVMSAIQQVSSNVTAIQRYTSNLGTPKDSEDMREKLHQINDATRELVQQTSKDIQLLGKFDGGSPNEAQQRKIQQTKLSKDFQVVLQRYSEIQKISAQKQREFVAQAKKRTESMRYEASHLPSDPQEEAKARLLEDQRRQQIMALDNEIEFNEAMIEEREEGIKEVEASIAQVNEIFKDLSFMIKEQGNTLDTIEANVSNVVDNTDGANVELTGANKYQKKARNKMCCLLLIGIIVLATLILVIVFNVA